MRITHLMWGLSTGGTENMLVDIVNSQIDKNDITLVVVNDLINETILGKLDKRVNVLFCNRKLKSKNPIPLIKFNYFIRKSKPDIVHAHYDGLARLIVGRGKWPLVRTFHSTTNPPEEVPYFDKIFAISKVVQDKWTKLGAETVLVENGLDCNLVNDKKSGLFSDGFKHFVQVSRLHVKEKGQDILIKALAKIKREKLCNLDFMMHFIGEGVDKASLQEMTKSLDVEDLVVFEGNKPRPWVYENLCNFDLFIQPSRNEGFGLTVAEAMLAKVPVISSNIEGPLEILTPKDGGSTKLFGRTFQSENADDLALKIVDFLSSDRDESALELARQHVLKNYSIKRTADRYMEEYRKLLGLS